MASFVRPFDPALARTGDPPYALLTLPDDGGAGFHTGAAPSINARYAGAPIELWHVASASGAPFPLLWPAAGTVRRVTLALHTDPRDPSRPVTPAALPVAGAALVELSPLPAGVEMRATLGVLMGGVPTFYVGLPAGVPVPEADSFVAQGTPAGSGASWLIGVVFQDRVSLSPRTWVGLLADAVGGAAGSAWRELLGLLPSTRRVRLLDHAGRPLAGALLPVAAGPQPTADAAGAIELLPGDVALRSPAGVLSVYGANSSAAADGPTGAASLVLPAALPGVDLQVLSLLDWFGASPHSPGRARWRLDSRFEPLVDGVSTFGAIAAELRAAAAAGSDPRERFGLQVFGWDLHVDFPLVDGDAASDLLSLVRAIRGAGGEVRFLISDIVSMRDPAGLQPVFLIAAVALPLAVGGALAVDVVRKDVSLSGWMQMILAFAGALGPAALASIGAHADRLLEVVEFGLNGVRALNAESGAGPPLALWVPYPARFTDNPLNLSVDPEDAARLEFRYRPRLPPIVDALRPTWDQFGTWHAKAQLVRKPRAGGGAEYVAFVGGMDFNPNRMDTPGHQGRTYNYSIDALLLFRGLQWPRDLTHDVETVAPFHDVQVRITGPGARDVFLFFDERYGPDLTSARLTPDAHPPVFSPPDEAALALTGENPRHIVKVGVTYLRARPKPIVLTDGSGTHTSEVSREADPVTDPFLLPMQSGETRGTGEASIHETLLAAIHNAREYIYIEDQYFTPANPSPGNPAPEATFLGALVGAARHCQRLVVVLPGVPDAQPFGADRRTFVFQRILDASSWGKRAIVASPYRRPFLPGAGRLVSRGRMWLESEVTASQVELVLAPARRLEPVPDRPFWLWVDGERMRVTDASPSSGRDGPTVTVTVIRGEDDSVLAPHGRVRLGTPRAHRAQAPVTLWEDVPIYVHAKVVIVDDVFVSIGSANVNRRGHFHDGELNAFAIPQELRFARDNPARALRCRLWAEQLGLPPGLGTALLDDPIEAFELFRRSRFAGNRSVPVHEIPRGPLLSISSISDATIAALLGTLFGADAPADIWNTIGDPTGWTDPDPGRGPHGP